jgi:hypothetical protein
VTRVDGGVMMITNRLDDLTLLAPGLRTRAVVKPAHRVAAPLDLGRIDEVGRVRPG